MWWMVIAACSGEPAEPVRAESPAVAVAPRLPPLPGQATGVVHWGEGSTAEGVTVWPVSLEVRPGLQVGAAWFEVEGGAQAGDLGAIVAPGHFGGGKSTAESQGVAWRLAAAGVPSLVVDTPGLEEWGGPERALHFQRGAHHRAWLLAGGSSAMALQVAGLSAGLDLLAARGRTRVVATGASGGAVQAFWLARTDTRVAGVVLAAVPDIPRRPDEAGCGCTAIPGLAGPQPTVLSALDVPSLWLSERENAPAGLPDEAHFEHMAGPHSYTVAMQGAAVEWVAAHFGVPGPTAVVAPAPMEIRTAGPGAPGEHRSLSELPLAGAAPWQPIPRDPGWPTAECRGAGRAVVTLGAREVDEQALAAVGLRSCPLVPPPTLQSPDAGVLSGVVPADLVAGAVQAAVAAHGAQGVYAVGGWSVAAAASGEAHVLRAPPATFDDIGEYDPPWVHVPGLWWGLLPQLWASAEAISDDPADLAAALATPADP